jgi:tetratricopeptide (TPR) repeat protein
MKSNPAESSGGFLPEPFLPYRQVFIYSFFILIITFAAYIPSMNGDFLWDDARHVLMKPGNWNLNALWRIWFTTETQQYYPLVYTSYWIERVLWGLSQTGSHIVNVAIHSANAVIAYLILRRLGLKGAWIAGIIFAIHPVHVESVAWLSERKNVLSGFFYLLALFSFLKFDDGLGRRWYLFSLGLFSLALLSKTVVCTLPVIFFLLRWLRGLRLDRRFIASLIPFFALGLAMGLLTIWWELKLVGAKGELLGLDGIERPLLAGRVIWFYLMKLVFPFNLSFIYPRWELDATALWQWLFTLGVIAAGLVLWISRKRIGRAPFAAMAFFVITLFPALGFFNVYPFRFSFVADHFQYLASLGPIAAAGVMAAWAVRKGGGAGQRVSMIKPALLIAVLAVFWVLTFRQTGVYKSPETLWRDTLDKNPRTWLVHNNYGTLLSSRNDVDGAIFHYKKAIELYPAYAKAHLNLGILYSRRTENLMNMGRRTDGYRYANDAILELEEALKVRFAGSLSKELAAIGYNNLGIVLAEVGRLDEAIEHFLNALARAPAMSNARANLKRAIGLKKQSERK